MRELHESKKYEGKARFTVVDKTKLGFAAEVKAFDLGTHGLVGIDANGKVAAKIPGHRFGKPEIERALSKLLGS